MGKVVFHVGLHMTGTTFLQRKVFLNIKEIELFVEGNKKWYADTKLSDGKINVISNENLSFGGTSFRENINYNPKEKREQMLD